jgi:hypothetical protein
LADGKGWNNFFETLNAGLSKFFALFYVYYFEHALSSYNAIGIFLLWDEGDVSFVIDVKAYVVFGFVGGLKLAYYAIKVTAMPFLGLYQDFVLHDIYV